MSPEFVGGYVAVWHVRSKRGAVNLGNGKLRHACCRLPSLVGGLACSVDNKFLAAERRIECARIIHMPFAVHFPVLRPNPDAAWQSSEERREGKGRVGTWSLRWWKLNTKKN